MEIGIPCECKPPYRVAFGERVSERALHDCQCLLQRIEVAGSVRILMEMRSQIGFIPEQLVVQEESAVEISNRKSWLAAAPLRIVRRSTEEIDVRRFHDVSQGAMSVVQKASPAPETCQRQIAVEKAGQLGSLAFLLYDSGAVENISF